MRADTMASQQMAQSSSFAASSSAVATANLKIKNILKINHVNEEKKKLNYTFIDTDLFSPGLHVVDDAKVVLVSADATLHLVEEISQLHEDDQACHGQPDVTEKLMRQTSKKRLKRFQEDEVEADTFI